MTREKLQATSLRRRPFPALLRLNFLRAAVALAAVFGFWVRSIVAGFASPDADPEPGLAFFSFFRWRD